MECRTLRVAALKSACASRRPRATALGGRGRHARSRLALLLAARLAFPLLANVLLESRPFGLLRVLVLLTRILVLAARTPVLVPSGFNALRLLELFLGNPFALRRGGVALGLPFELRALASLAVARFEWPP